MSDSSSDETSSSSRSSSPDEEAAPAPPAAAAAAGEPAAAKPTPKRKRVTKVKPSPSLTRDLIVLCMTVGLGVVLDQKQVAAASAAIVADPSVEEMVQKLEEQLGNPSKKKRRAPGTAEPKGKLKNAYTMFVSAVFEELKEAGISGVPITDVGRIWQALPAETRADITQRFNALHTDYNATVAAGEGIGLGKALAAHDKAHNLGRINYMSLYNQFKGSAAAAAAAAAAGGDKPKPKAEAKPGNKAAAAPAAAAAAAAAAPAAEEQPAKKQKKEKVKQEKQEKEKKKDKKHKEEPEPEAAAPTTEKKKHKKHKVKQEEQ